MEREKLKEAIKEQAKLVKLELDSTGNGYLQALQWVGGLLEQKEIETVNTGNTVVVESK